MADPIVTEGNPVLRQKAKEVPKHLFGSAELDDIIARMSASLRTTHNGVAIAAPQIGISYRIFVVAGFVIAGHPRNPDDPDVAFINPKITRRSLRRLAMEEGCLSVPGVYGMIVRSVKASVAAYDRMGKKFSYNGTELLAEIFQHECDHLDGTLFIDTADPASFHAERQKPLSAVPEPDEKKA